ncbi:MAG TPA: Fe-S cluster assembly protein SufD, partial [Burkholderiales bacterium]
MSAVETWLETFRAQAAGLPGADLPWLVATRNRAMERFAEVGWPTNRMENWRHTSLALLGQQEFGTRTADDSAARIAAQLRHDDAGHWLVFVDGRFAPSLSAIGSLPAGAYVSTLVDALANRPEQVQAVFGNAEEGESPAALNAALATDGAFIHLARGVVIEAPIHLLFIGGVAQGVSQLRNFVIAEDASQATIAER